MSDPVRFDRFMDDALYGPSGFYSRSGRAGRSGDFLTAVEVGPLFGAVTARALDRWWDELGRPEPFVVAEAGAGRGQWCRTVRAAGPACSGALRWIAVERSSVLAAEATSAADEVRPDLPPSAHVVLANELLDNLAVRIVRRAGAGWDELHVLDGEPRWRPTPERFDLDVPDGAVVPWAAEAARWVEVALEVAAHRVVCLDYGAPTARLAARPWREWFRTYVAHRPGGEPWAAAGTQDLTCEVPWDQLPGAPQVTSQADWLRRHGLDELVDEGRRTWRERAHIGDLAAVAARSRVSEAAALTDPDGMGSFLVLEWLDIRT